MKPSDKLTTNKGDDRSDHIKEDETANEKLQPQLPLLSHDHELTNESGNGVKDTQDNHNYSSNNDDDREVEIYH